MNSIEEYNASLEKVNGSGVSAALQLRDAYLHLYENDKEAFWSVYGRRLPLEFVDKISTFDGCKVNVSVNKSINWDGSVSEFDVGPVCVHHLFGIQRLGAFEVPIMLLSKNEDIESMKMLMKL
jgi:hypothetical protein